MILVTGMHRSGTSLVSMTLESLGVSFGDHAAFYGADRWNSLGYYERRDVMDINSRMITGCTRTGSRFAATMGQIRYLSLPDRQTIVRRGRELSPQISEIGERLREGAIKDPRLCLTWSVWIDNVDVEACVLCIRHPIEVADSLWRRQRIPTSWGLRFWRYHIGALVNPRPPNLIPVEVNRLVTRPDSELRILINALGLDVSVAEAGRRFRERFNRGMMTSGSGLAGRGLDDRTRELWEWLLSLRVTPIPEQ